MPSAGCGVNTGSPGAPIQHDTVRAIRIVERELERRSATERIADEVRPRNIQRVYKIMNRLRHEAKHTAFDFRLVAFREPRQVGQDDAEQLGKWAYISAVIAPAAPPGPPR